MLNHGFGECQIWCPNDIDIEFRRLNYETFKQERGVGLWLWKPYIIYQTMLNAQDGDIVIYSDAGIEFIDNVNHIINRMDQDVFLFNNGWPHINWCKADVMYEINRWVVFESFKDIKQAQASNIFIINSVRSRRFVKEWLLWCQMPGLIDDSPSIIPNNAHFSEHRHDQAILTALSIKHNIERHWFPSTTAMNLREDNPGDTYPTLFNHHRKRNNEY
jgi:hypothetical protein